MSEVREALHKPVFDANLNYRFGFNMLLPQALHTPGWNDSQLARLQAAWRPLDFLGELGNSFEMERAQFILTFERGRHSEKEASDMLAAYGSGFNAGPAPPLSSPGETIVYVTVNFPDLCRKAIYIPVWQFAWAETHAGPNRSCPPSRCRKIAAGHHD